MNRRVPLSLRVELALFLLAVFLFAAPLSWSQAIRPGTNLKEGQELLPEGPGKQTFVQACTVCHALARTTREKFAPEDWDQLVRHMVDIGAPLKDNEIPAVVDYLSKNFAGGPKPVGVVIP